MSTNIVIIEHQKDWKAQYPDANIILAKDYILSADWQKKKGLRIINLCRSYRYLSFGYYVSLLGEARRHRVFPSVRTITDLSRKSIYSLNIESMEDQINQATKGKIKQVDGKNKFDLDVYFGVAESADLQDLARAIFDLFPCPLLTMELRLQNKWELSSIKTLSLAGLQADQQHFFANAFQSYLGKRWRKPKMPQISKLDLAILHNPKEKLPPSRKEALQRFVSVGKKLGITVDLLEKKDYNSLSEYDALFIRETTAINHHTYTFAKKAETEGMVVIDDPDSIVKCTNKVYLFELLTTHKIPVPHTKILTFDDLKQKSLPLQYPAVLKIPDGSFSRGIFKAQNETEARDIAARLLKESEVILAQEYMYTDFDWRIGVLNKEILFACQYFMSKAHWQIVKHDESGEASEGTFKTFELHEVPRRVLETALAASKLIGDGLYGVDIKETPTGIFVIEINDNPNIDAGVEDKVLGEKLYEKILLEFKRRVDAQSR